MSKLGEFLKTAREQKGLTIHEIGLSLKISSKILKAIEDGNSQDLPAKTFLRGFVKSYAQYLKLNQNEVLEMFQAEYGSTRPEAPQSPQGAITQKDDSSQKSNSQPQVERLAKRNEDIAVANRGSQRHYSIAIAIVLLILIAFVAKMMDKYAKESDTQSQSELVESLSTTTTLPSAAETISGNTAETISATGNNSVAATTSAGPVSGAPLTSAVPATSLSTTTTVPPTTTTTLKPIATTTTTLASPTTTLPKIVPTTTTTTTTVSSTTSTTVRAAVTEVIVEALNQVKIRFSLNGGQKWDSLDLAADQVHTFRARGNVELEVSDGGAINIIVNGRDRGVPGTIGKPMKLTLPK